MNFLTYGTGLLGTWDDPALSCTASRGGGSGASHETPSALEPASYARAGEARLVERDLGEDALQFTVNSLSKKLKHSLLSQYTLYSIQ